MEKMNEIKRVNKIDRNSIFSYMENGEKNR